MQLLDGLILYYFSFHYLTVQYFHASMVTTGTITSATTPCIVIGSTVVHAASLV